jgi:hypothetical protein
MTIAMLMRLAAKGIVPALFMSALAAPAMAQTTKPLTVSVDLSKHVIGLNVTVKNKPLYMLLDTGVSPSVIDLGTAEQLGLPLNRKAAGEGSGEGSGKAEAMPSSIRQLKIGGEAFGDVEALATDLKNLSAIYGRPLNGVLGYSFLKDKTVLIDYPATTVTIYSGANNGPVALSQCRKYYAAGLQFLGDEHFPLMPDCASAHCRCLRRSTRDPIARSASIRPHCRSSRCGMFSRQPATRPAPAFAANSKA